VTALTPAEYADYLRAYLAALAAGDGAGVASRLSESVVWHVAGTHPLSGRHVGRENVVRMLAAFKERSGGTVRLQPGPAMFNGALAVVPLHFSARRPGKVMSMSGVDVFRLGPSGIEEVWLFSVDQEGEDLFWE
jgi:uncharacterized protein